MGLTRRTACCRSDLDLGRCESSSEEQPDTAMAGEFGVAVDCSALQGMLESERAPTCWMLQC